VSLPQLSIQDPDGVSNVELRISVPAGRTITALQGPAGTPCTTTGSTASCSYAQLPQGSYSFSATVLRSVADAGSGVGELTGSYLFNGDVVRTFNEAL
jgi:hypothetical protein